jgi:hypothetical protein
MRAILLISILALAGCGAAATQQEIAATENGFIAAERLAMAYMVLPPCAVPKPTSGAGAICSDPAIKAVIKAKDNEAYNAFIQFQGATKAGASADLAAMEVAISAFVASIPAPVAAPVATK